MEHMFELNGFMQDMDGCNNCHGRCRGNCFEVYCGGGCAHVGK